MSWQDRQREAAITTPDGTRFVFLFEDLERNRSENTSIFKFAEKSGAFIQRLSSGQDIYPLTVIFSGADYDLTAEDFWEKTKQPGVFLLEHPRFIGLKRTQLLTIRERRAAKTADNQASFDIVLHETLEIVQPSTALDTTAQILITALKLSAESAKAFEVNAELDNALVVGDLQAESTSFIDDVNEFFAEIAAKEAAISAAFDAQFLSVQSTIDDIVEGPLEFADNLAVFVATPSRVFTDISDRIDAYGDLFDNTVDRLKFSVDDVLDAAKNKGALGVLTSMGIISGSCQASVSNASYATRALVIAIADKIIDMNDRTIELLDEYSDEFVQEDNPADRRFEITDARNIQNDLVSLTVGRLFEIAFTLRQERFITLDRERSTVDLAHELYGYSDDNLDFLIETNKLRGDKIYLIPQGTEIVYYI